MDWTRSVATEYATGEREIKEKPIIARPSWTKKTDLLDLLISPKPWKFENEKDKNN